jgi:hypothetical protein
MFCEACRKYRSPRPRVPSFCEVCGSPLAHLDLARAAADRERIRYLLAELRAWSQAGAIDRALRDRLSPPYEAELATLASYLDGYELATERPVPPRCHDQADHASEFCPDCGSNLATWRAQWAAASARSSETVTDAAPPHAAMPPGTAMSPSAQPAPAPEPAAPRRARRLLRELRPVFYENLLLFVGAFLMFAGSIYFAIYFWDRFGRLGPLVAGGLLAIYGLGFAATGYLLQRRYHAELSARVLYGVATAILPVASTLLGEPIRTGSAGVALVAGACVAVFGAIAYPAIVTAASLFQREIGVPFARAFVVLLWAIGAAPLVAASGVHALGVLYVYLAALPILAMYRRVREVGRVFERATVVYVVGGSAYLVAAVAVRLVIAMSPAIEPAALAPLLVAVATAAIDLDVSWRQQSFAARSALGVVGVLAHAAAVLAIAIAFVDPVWRVVATLSAGLVFAVTALRHRRPSAVHIAIATTAAGAALIAWIPAADPPHGVAFGGLLLLPIGVGLARLGARWRRHAAIEYAAPCELWAVLCPVIAALATLLPLAGDDWQLAQLQPLGDWAAPLPALVVLPVSAGALALAWSWGRRRLYLAVAAVAAAAAVLVAVGAAGAAAWSLALAAAGLALAIAGGAALSTRRGVADASEALLDAALALVAATGVILGATWLGPWHGTSALAAMATYLLAGAAAIAVAAQRPRRELGVAAVLCGALAGAAALWDAVPRALIPGLVAIALLALDRLRAGAAIGKARPFRDAYAVALAAVVLQVVAIVATTTALTAISPAAVCLVALALAAIAARHRSPWPTYGAVGCAMLAAYGVPAAVEIALAPRAAVEIAGLVAIAVALALRTRPRLDGWRTTFLDVPLHLAAVAAPLGLVRFAVAFADAAASDAPDALLLARRLASALALAVLAAVTHGSRAHAYLAVAAACVVPAAVALAVLDADTVAVALAAAAAVLALPAAHAIARRAAFDRPIAHGDRPLPLFGLWPLPSAATRRALWHPPVAALGLIAALAAWTLAGLQTAAAWPHGSATAAATYGLLAAYAIARCVSPLAGDRRLAAALAAHAACALVALIAADAAQLLGREPRGAGLVALGAGYLVLGELLARSRHPAAPRGARAAALWSIGCSLAPVTLLAHAARITTPAAAAVLALAVVRYAQRYPARGLRTAASIAITAASGYAVLWLVGLAGWLDPEAAACAALAVTAALAAWAHWLARRRAALGAPVVLASAWAAIGAVLAAASGALDLPASAPALLPPILAIAALLLAAAWFGFAAVWTGRARFGFAAEAALVVIYACIRTSPLGDGLGAQTDAIVAIAAAFALHFAGELLHRAGLTALEHPAVFGARMLPAAACLSVLWLAIAGQSRLSSVEHAAFAATLGLLYTLGFRRGGHPALAFVALGFYNLGVALLWSATGRHDALYYVVPVGVSISLLARIYRDHMTRSARRSLRAAGALLIYFAAYYQVVQFDHGLYALLLGGFTLAGILLGFALQLRELFTLSIGFLVLDVTSNLAYYGVHRPVLGWTLLTVAGLCLTASGIVFQLRRGQVRGFVAGVRATLAKWD